MADKFEHVSEGDLVVVSRTHAPSLRYRVYHVTAKRFHGREETYGWYKDFRKSDGRSLGVGSKVFAEPSDCSSPENGSGGT